MFDGLDATGSSCYAAWPVLVSSTRRQQHQSKFEFLDFWVKTFYAYKRF
jgi:hypothetical protein